MQKVIIIIFIIFSSKPELFAQSDKNGARLFFQSIIQSYFNNGDKFLSSFNDSVHIIGMQGDTLIAASVIKQQIDTAFFNLKLRNSTKRIVSYENYLKKYSVLVYSQKEFTGKTYQQVKYDTVLSKSADMPIVFAVLNMFKKGYADNDYLIVGCIPKFNVDEVISGLYWMVLRKTKQGWKIVGISP